MTISTITPKPPANAGTRSERATLARMRAADIKSAAVLRERGWAVMDPDHMAALGRLVAEYAAGHRVPVADIWGALGMETPDARD